MRKLNANKFFTLLLVIILFTTSCNKSELIKTRETESCIVNVTKPRFITHQYEGLTSINYTKKICGLLPLGINYKWIYRDSIFNTSGVFVEIKLDTLLIEKTVQADADNSIIWVMKSKRSKGLQRYMYSTDSVLFFTDKVYNPANPTLPLFASEWLKIPAQNTITNTSMVSDIAYMETTKKLNNVVTVPAGSFTDCVDVMKSYDGKQNIIFKPELGIVKFTMYESFTSPFAQPLPTDKRQVSELIAFIK